MRGERFRSFRAAIDDATMLRARDKPTTLLGMESANLGRKEVFCGYRYMSRTLIRIYKAQFCRFPRKIDFRVGLIEMLGESVTQFGHMLCGPNINPQELAILAGP